MIRVFPDKESMSRGAAELFAKSAEDAVCRHGRFLVALAGGGTPRRTYEMLAAAPMRDRIAWQTVFIFWGDERCVPVSDPRSNARMARRSFLDHVPIPLKQIYPMACDGKDAASAAAEYEALLKRHFEGAFPSFDLVFLGLGENGHTASLFPGTAVLRERRRWVRAMSLPEQEMHRLSLTAPAINRAERILFLVSGAGKADVLHTVLQGPRDPERWPAQLIEPANGELYWYADADAAARIHRQ